MTTSPSSSAVFDIAATLDDIGRFQAVIDAWAPEQQHAVGAYRKAIESLNAEAFRRLIRAVKADAGGMAALRQVMNDDLVYGVLHHHGLIKPDLHEAVEAALQSVRPMLAAHNGDVELVRVVPPDTAEVRFIGACDSCPASALTFHAGVKKAIQEHCPAITKIVQVKGIAHAQSDGVRFISPFSVPEGGTWLPVCTLAEIPPAGALFTRVGTQPVIVSHTDAGVQCFQNACAHMGWPLDNGAIADGILTCPSHGFRYDLRSGECLTAPEVQLEVHAVRVIGDRVEVRLAA